MVPFLSTAPAVGSVLGATQAVAGDHVAFYVARTRRRLLESRVSH
jgi:hypothetical protein